MHNVMLTFDMCNVEGLIVTRTEPEQSKKDPLNFVNDV